MFAKKVLIALSLPFIFSLTACGGDGGGGDADQNVVRDIFAVGDIVETKEDGGEVVGDVSTNDLGDNLSFALADGQSTQNGTITFNSDGTFSYTPNLDFFGSDSITYVATNTITGATSTAALTINVVNDFERLDEYGWELVWSDNFNTADAFDSSLWVGDNITVSGGSLKINAIDGQSNIVKGVQPINKGRIEAGVRTAAGVNAISAFKLVPITDIYDGDNALSLMLAEDGEMTAGAHYGLDRVSGVLMNERIIDTASDEFHIYAIEWGEKKIRWYIDDTHVYTVDTLNLWGYNQTGDDIVADTDGPFNQPMQIIFDVSAAAEDLPTQLLVDYVNVWACNPALEASIEECASREKSKISRSASDRIESVGAEKTIILEDGYKDPATKALISELHPLNWHYLDDVFALEASNDNVSDSDITWVTLEDEHNLVLDFVNASGPAAMGIAVLNDVADSVKSVELNGHNIALNFDLLVDSADSTTDSIIIKMESGDEGTNDLAAGQVSWSLDELTLDDWVSYSIPVTDFLNNPSAQLSLDPNNLTSLMTLEVNGGVHLQLDNISLGCINSEGCLQGPLALQTAAAPKADPIRIQAENFITQEGTGVEETTDEGGGENVAFVSSGDFVSYTFEAPAIGPYTVDYRVASKGGSSGFEMSLDGGLIHSQSIPDTGDWQNWVTVTSPEFELAAGVYTMQIDFVDEDQNLNWLQIQPPLGEVFVEAEDYDVVSGIDLEDTGDVGGGQNIGWIDQGDFIEYTVNIPSTGEYLIQYRVAGLWDTLGFENRIGGVLVDTHAMDSTGDWQNWVTQSSVINLIAGEQTMRFDFIDGPININWIRLTRQ
jgi:hypothetical protein